MIVQERAGGHKRDSVNSREAAFAVSPRYFRSPGGCAGSGTTVVNGALTAGKPPFPPRLGQEPCHVVGLCRAAEQTMAAQLEQLAATMSVARGWIV